jgi:hypothetical protein
VQSWWLISWSLLLSGSPIVLFQDLGNPLSQGQTLSSSDFPWFSQNSKLCGQKQKPFATYTYLGSSWYKGAGKKKDKKGMLCTNLMNVADQTLCWTIKIAGTRLAVVLHALLRSPGMDIKSWLSKGKCTWSHGMKTYGKKHMTHTHRIHVWYIC